MNKETGNEPATPGPAAGSVAAGDEWWRQPITWNPHPSWLSFLVLGNVDRLIRRAYNAQNLEMGDTLRLDEQKTQTLLAAFQLKWDAELAMAAAAKAAAASAPPPVAGAKPAKPPAEASLARALFSGHALTFLGTGCLYSITLAAQFAGPLLLQQIVGGLACNANGPGSPGAICYSNYNIMYLWAALLFVAPLIRAFAEHHNNYLLIKLGVALRNQLMAAVYRKSLRLNNTALQSESVGKMVTLMSNDCVKVQDAMLIIHIAWGSPVLIAVALALLYGVLQWSMFVGLAVMLAAAPLSGWLAAQLGKTRLGLVGWTDKRVGLMSEIIGGIRVIKLFAWEAPSIARVDALRAEELKKLTTIAWLAGFFGLILFSVPTFVALAAFVAYTKSGNILTAQSVYTALAYFAMLRFPLAFLPFFITQIINMLVSLGRLQKFLQAGEVGERPSDAGVRKGTLAITGGEFRWDETSEKPTLADIDLTVEPGSLTMVVGGVGSGKSSILAAFINHISRSKGAVTVAGSVAYVAQTAYILNDTVQANILFGLSLDARRYAEALRVSQLGPDLAILPHGDMTEIGERGITMSGGQKQRVSIARAVYADADIVLLDDPLSAVDAHVGAALFEQCLAGVLKGKTRILVTNALQYLPQADRVICMADGKVREAGTFAELSARGLQFATLMAEHRIEDEGDDGAGAGGGKAGANGGASGGANGGANGAVPPSPKSPPARASVDGARKSIEGSRKSTEADRKNRRSAEIKAKPKPVKDDKNLTGAEDRKLGSVSGRYYWLYVLSAGGLPVLLALILLYALEQGTAAATSAWLGVWAGQAIRGWPLDNYLGVYVGLAGANSMMTCIRSLTFSLSCVRAAKALHYHMLRNVMRQPSSFFDSTPSGRILNRFSKDQETVDSALSMSLIQLCGSLATVFTTLVVIAVATVWFSIALLPLLVLYFFIQRYYVPTAREIARVEALSRSPIYAGYSEAVTGVSTIRAFRQEGRFTLANDKQIEDNAAAITTQRLAAEWLGLRLDFLGVIIAFLCAVLAVSGGIAPGLAGLALVYSLDVTAYLKVATNMASDVEGKFNAVERIDEYSHLPQEPPAELTALPGQAGLPPAWPEQGAIEFEDVVMRYRPTTPLVLKGVTFSIRPGEKVGVCGRTGSGKSTLMLALFRMVDLEGGCIRLDGRDITTVGLRALRSGMAMIPQDPFMFSGTARSNLDPFSEFADESIWAALGRVGLKAVIEADDKKLDMAVTDNGSNFSQGQRQLFCMARALLRGRKVLMMDEATASVDLDTDVLIQRTVREAFGHCTVLTVAHRLNTIMDSDRVLVMDAGTVAEYGPPGELLAAGGLFRALVDNTGKKNAAYLRSLARTGGLSSAALAPPPESESDDDDVGGSSRPGGSRPGGSSRVVPPAAPEPNEWVDMSGPAGARAAIVAVPAVTGQAVTEETVVGGPSLTATRSLRERFGRASGEEPAPPGLDSSPSHRRGPSIESQSGVVITVPDVGGGGGGGGGRGTAGEGAATSLA